MMDRPTPKDPRDETFVRLLRLLDADEAPPQAPSEIGARRAKEAVRAEWARTVRAGRRRRLAVLSAAAIAALVALWIAIPRWAPDLLDRLAPRQDIATLVKGDAHDADGLRLDAPIHGGTVLTTDADGGAALRLADGRSLRLAPSTEVKLRSTRRLDLRAGAVYVDAPPTDSEVGTSLAIHTPFGVARNLATQFEVRIEDDALRLRVREGRVLLETADEDLAVDAGSEVQVRGDVVEHGAVARSGAPWQPWVDLASFSLEGSTLDGFLHWYRRETGRAVAWTEPELALRAGSIVLHGSLGATLPDESPEVVLPTCGLSGRIEITTAGERLLIGARRTDETDQLRGDDTP